MKAYGKFAAFVAAILASRTAAAQDATEPATEPAATEAPAPVENASGWTTYPGERHVVGRLMGGSGLRLFDPYGAGLFLPPWFLIEGHFLVANVGSWHIGPSLGAQLGIDTHSSLQWAIQPGVMAMNRLSDAFAVTLRVDLPILFTRGHYESQAVGSMANPQPNFPPPQGSQPGSSNVVAPIMTTTDVGFGIEAGIGAAYYLTAGIGITAEINGGVYFGEGFYTLPYLGGGLGLLVDYELLP